MGLALREVIRGHGEERGHRDRHDPRDSQPPEGRVGARGHQRKGDQEEGVDNLSRIGREETEELDERDRNDVRPGDGVVVQLLSEGNAEARVGVRPSVVQHPLHDHVEEQPVPGSHQRNGQVGVPQSQCHGGQQDGERHRHRGARAFDTPVHPMAAATYGARARWGRRRQARSGHAGTRCPTRPAAIATSRFSARSAPI